MKLVILAGALIVGTSGIAIAQTVPAIQRRWSLVPSMTRSHRPVLTGAMPNVTAVATAAPLRVAAVRNVPWKMAVAAAAASRAGQAASGVPASRESNRVVTGSRWPARHRLRQRGLAPGDIRPGRLSRSGRRGSPARL